MALFQFKWLRNFVRRNTSPIPHITASIWKQRLSVVYALLAWNAFGFVCYMFYTGRGDWADYYGLKSPEEKQLSPAQNWASHLNIPKAKVIRIAGFEKINEMEIDNTQKEENEK